MNINPVNTDNTVEYQNNLQTRCSSAVILLGIDG